MISPEAEIALRSAVVCTLSMALGNEPYAVPVSYGYADGRLYFHGSGSGRKLDTLRANPQVCFSVVLTSNLRTADLPCKWSFSYRSLVGFGSVSEVVGIEEKRLALDVLMRQHSRFLGQEELTSYEYSPSSLEHTTVLCLKIDEVSLKEH
jgi:nitroimidazol reductase NimA-like FMN-containing flavoprotein (pyridoxamine 5'-phosphate oxidase superfamily)